MSGSSRVRSRAAVQFGACVCCWRLTGSPPTTTVLCVCVRACLIATHVRNVQVAHPFPLCCLARVRRDGNLLRLSKQATLQFVVVKPTMSILGLLVLALGEYFATPFQVLLCLFVYLLVYMLQ